MRALITLATAFSIGYFGGMWFGYSPESLVGCFGVSAFVGGLLFRGAIRRAHGR